MSVPAASESRANNRLKHSYRGDTIFRMKVAISLPDPLFKAAEQLASHTGKSRSQLYAEALARYLEANQGAIITEQLNAVYGSQPAQLDPALHSAQLQTLSDETW
jgi:hypothetical protein